MGPVGRGRDLSSLAQPHAQPRSPDSPPRPSAGPLSPAAFLSQGEEAHVYLGKAGGSGQGPRCWAGLGPRTEGSRRDHHVPLDPILLQRLALRRPEPPLIGLNEASVLIVQRVGKAPGLMHSEGRDSGYPSHPPMLPRREAEAVTWASPGRSGRARRPWAFTFGQS